MQRDHIIKRFEDMNKDGQIVSDPYFVGAWSANGLVAPVKPNAQYDLDTNYVWLLCQTQPSYRIVGLIPNREWKMDPDTRVSWADPRVRVVTFEVT